VLFAASNHSWKALFESLGRRGAGDHTVVVVLVVVAVLFVAVVFVVVVVAVVVVVVVAVGIVDVVVDVVVFVALVAGILPPTLQPCWVSRGGGGGKVGKREGDGMRSAEARMRSGELGMSGAKRWRSECSSAATRDDRRVTSTERGTRGEECGEWTRPRQRRSFNGTYCSF